MVAPRSAAKMMLASGHPAANLDDQRLGTGAECLRELSRLLVRGINYFGTDHSCSSLSLDAHHIPPVDDDQVRSADDHNAYTSVTQTLGKSVRVSGSGQSTDRHVAAGQADEQGRPTSRRASQGSRYRSRSLNLEQSRYSGLSGRPARRRRRSCRFSCPRPRATLRAGGGSDPR